MPPLPADVVFQWVPPGRTGLAFDRPARYTREVIFSKVPPETPLITIPIPIVRNSGSPNLLETFLLLAAGRIVNPKRIFEIGTFRGLTTRILAANFPESAIYTLDLDQSHSVLPSRLLPGNGRQIIPLEGHSMSFDFAAWEGTCGLVFVDGGHDYTTVAADTQQAFDMLQCPGPSAIVWHDCGNSQCPGVAQALQERPEAIYQVEESQIAIYFTS